MYRHGLASLAAVIAVACSAYVCASTLPPCLYEGHIKTGRDWQGNLANISVMTTGRMTFHFTYPADKCCPNVLFYLEEQMSIINTRMNCWQKEAVLRPEDDQILRLTPRFAWSGCHMSHPNGIATYVCAGGRSFATTTPGSDRPTTWFVAISNCPTLAGLDLKYRIEVIGHIGDCVTAPSHDLTTTSASTTPEAAPNAAAVQPKPRATTLFSERVCVIEGLLNKSMNWFGFLTNFTLSQGGSFKFRFSYPAAMQVQNVILYNEEDVRKLKLGQSCWQREGIIRSNRVHDQILDLSYRSSWNGCATSNATTTSPAMLVCEGKRRYDSTRKIFVAVSNCRSQNALLLNYSFVVTGYEGDLCSAAPNLHHQHSFVIVYTISVVIMMKVSMFTAWNQFR